MTLQFQSSQSVMLVDYPYTIKDFSVVSITGWIALNIQRVY